MSAVGGSIESVSFRGRYFSVAGDAESNRKIGGYENEVQVNGDGTSRLIKNRVAAKLDGLVLSVDDFLGDHEFLQELANEKDFFETTISYASNAVWQGSMQFTEELQFSNANTSATVTCEGTGILTQQ